MALWAAAKSGKSELTLWCATKLALGEHPWTGQPVDPVDVLYIDLEMTEDDLEERPVRDPLTVDLPGREAELGGARGHLLAAAVDDDDGPAGPLEADHEVDDLRERAGRGGLPAADLEDEWHLRHRHVRYAALICT